MSVGVLSSDNREYTEPGLFLETDRTRVGSPLDVVSTASPSQDRLGVESTAGTVRVRSDEEGNGGAVRVLKGGDLTPDEIWGIAVKDGSVEWNYDLDAPFPVVREQGGSPYTAETALTSLETSGAASWSRDSPGDETLYPDVGEEYLVAAAGRTVYGFDLDAAPGGPGDVTGDDRPATDPDGDGDYEDVDGSGGFGIQDVATLINVYDGDAVQDNASAFDYDDDEVDIVDVVTLLGEL